ncbi:MAG TPA: NERD domain-containing protein, partial [Nocardioides sp.]
IVGHDVPVTGVLCFVDADWPLIGGGFTTRGVDVLWPKKLYARLIELAPGRVDVAALHRQLADALPSA